MTKNVYKEIFEEYYKPLCLFGRKMLSCEKDAEDIVHNIFLSIWERQMSFIDKSHLKAYLFQAVYNQSLTLIRRQNLIQSMKEVQKEEIDENNYLKERIESEVFWETFKALENVERPEMESGWKNFISSMNLAWKTGTSFGFRDAWAVGVNPEYVIGVWVGNADGEGRPDLVGVRAAAPILFEVAGLLPTNRRFYMPGEEMTNVPVCRQSGYRASDLCEEVDTLYICASGMKTATCPFHHLIHLDVTGKWRVTSDCEAVHNMKTKSWFVLPPVQEWYYCRTHTGYQKLPPYRPDCQHPGEEVMEMVYPQRGIRVFIPRDFGGKPGRVVFEAVHRSPEAEIFWHVDNQYLGTTYHIHQMELYLKEGAHVLTLVDGDGNILQQAFRVVGKDISPKM